MSSDRKRSAIKKAEAAIALAQAEESAAKLERDRAVIECELLKVEKTDHPDLVGGIVWTDRELDWIRAYGKRCYNYGFAKGIAITQAHDRALDDENKWPEVEVDHG